MAGALVPFALAYGLVLLFALRRPMLRRLAVREAVRRRGQSVLVIVGLMVGTATITGALIGADSVSTSAVDSFAYRNWGHVDLTVTTTNRFFDPSISEQLAADPQVAAATDGVAPGIELVGSAADLDKRQGASRVTVVGFDPASQQPFGAYELVGGAATFGEDLGRGEVLVSRTLAQKIQAEPGDRLRVSIESSTPATGVLRIAGIARSTGPGAYTLGSAVFAPVRTVQDLVGVEGINIVRISAPGGVRDSLPAARAALPVLRAAVDRIAPELTVGGAKVSDVDNSEQFTGFISAMLVGMSAIVIAAGAALIVNIMGMLAEERRTQMGVLRALGLKRRRLVGLSVIEGALYSLAAGVVGAAVGIGLGRIIATRFGNAFAEFAGDEFDFQFAFHLEISTLVAGFAIGSLLTLLVVLVASWRTSRMTITAAIRDLPEPPRQSHRWVQIGRRVAGTVGGMLLLALREPAATLAGIIVLILVTSSIIKPRLHPRVHATVTGLALAAASFLMIAGMNPDADSGAFFGVFVIAMLTSVFGLTTLVAGNLKVVERLVGLAGHAFGRMRVILRPPLAYLARRPTRTGLTTGVFGLIIGMLTMFSVFYVVFSSNYESFAGGFDVRVLSTGARSIELPDEVRRDVRDAMLIPTQGYIGPVRGGDEFSNAERALVPLFHMPDRDVPIPLMQRGSGYETDADVWAAVVTDPSKVITTFGSSDKTITLFGDDGPVTYDIAGVQPFGLLDGIFARPSAFEPFASAPRGASMLIDVREGVDAEVVARAVESALFEQGVDADSVQSLLDQADRANRAFFSTIDILMRMGLVVGILALGIVALRIITERRHVIGVLRALGYRSRAVMTGLMTEAFVTATIGSVVGIAVGLTMGYIFWRQDDTGTSFGVDLASLGGVLALVYTAVVLVTVVPAWRASKLPPAEAVRYSE